MTFSDMGLCPALLQASTERGWLSPSAVQTAAIPVILQGGDVLVSADTGSGKTAAFALPLLQRWQETTKSRPRQIQFLVLVPTRELAAQVGETLVGLASHLTQPPKVSVLFGGVSINPQMMGLRGGSDIVVATPGRLLDLIDHNALQLASVSTLVLDEADRLLDLGFSEELTRIVALLPKQRQTLLFSATLPVAIEELAAHMLHQPLRIALPSLPQTQPDIHQRVIEVDDQRRTQLLRQLIVQQGWDRTLVFVATKYATEIVADKLRRAGLTAEPFHGQLSQGKRNQVLADFRASKLQVVVATDLAARGLDISQLPVVINYDLPRSAVDYTHRIGRTGRAGESGLAISLISAASAAHFRLIEKRQGLQLGREQIAGFEPTELAAAASATTDANGGIKGKRPSKKDKLRQAALKN
ncbi:MAG: DEAD/DEAH box helicase [Burkholderiaceae bacterium]